LIRVFNSQYSSSTSSKLCLRWDRTSI